MDGGAGDPGFPGSDQLRRGRICGVNRIVLRQVNVAAVIGQPVRRPGTLVSNYLDWRAGASIGLSDRDRRYELREPAVVGNIVNVDFGTAAAVMAVVRGEELAPLVDL